MTGRPSERVVGAVRLAQPRQLAERGEVGQARGADLAAALRGERSALIGPPRRLGPASAGRVRPAAGALARVVVLGGHGRHQAVEARLAGELGVERGGDDVALADGDDPPVVEPGEDVDVRARSAR